MAIIVSHKELPSLTFFGDSSSRNAEFMVAGGFVIPASKIAEVEQRVADLRNGANISEFHWAEYRGGDRRDAYHELVRYAFELIEQRHAELHLIIARFKGYNHKRKPGENRDTSVSRMYWLLGLYRLGQFYSAKRQIQMRLDSGNDCKGICNMRDELCAAIYHEYGAANSVRSITPVCSTKSGIVQMADVFVGAVAAKRNGVVHSAKTEKGPLADAVLAGSGRPSWDVSTPKGARGVTVWNHKGK